MSCHRVHTGSNFVFLFQAKTSLMNNQWPVLTITKFRLMSHIWYNVLHNHLNGKSATGTGGPHYLSLHYVFHHICWAKFWKTLDKISCTSRDHTNRPQMFQQKSQSVSPLMLKQIQFYENVNISLMFICKKYCTYQPTYHYPIFT